MQKIPTQGVLRVHTRDRYVMAWDPYAQEARDIVLPTDRFPLSIHGSVPFINNGSYDIAKFDPRINEWIDQYQLESYFVIRDVFDDGFWFQSFYVFRFKDESAAVLWKLTFFSSL